MDHERYRTTRFFGSLDGLRAVSVVGVVWHHTQHSLPALPISRRGFLGVDMFFVISGFLITTLLLRERDGRGGIALGRFYARRFLRIFPLYYGLLAALTLVFLLVIPDAAMAGPFFEDLPWYATYTSNWLQAQTVLALTWSLSAEEQFYLAWPPLLKHLGKGALWVVGAVIAAGLAVSFGLLDPLLAEIFGPDFRHLEILQATFTPIALGVLAACVLHGAAGYARLARVLGGARGGRGAPIVLALAVLGAANLPVADLWGWPRPLIQLLMAALVVACVVREDHLLAPLLRQRLVRRVGTISYGVYLYHIFALQGAREILLRGGIRWPLDVFVVTLLLTVGIAELSYRYYERPFLRLKNRF